MLTARYDHDGRDYMIIATVAQRIDSAAGTDLRQLVDLFPPDTTVLIDLYVTSETSEDEAGGPDARAGRIRDKIGIIPARGAAGGGRRAQARRLGGGRGACLVHLLRRAGQRGRDREPTSAGCTRWSPSGSACGAWPDSS